MLHLVYALLLIVSHSVMCQNTDDEWFDILKYQGSACKKNTCRQNDDTCECYLTVEHRLTMMNEEDKMLLVPFEGRFRPFNNTKNEYDKEEKEFISADGYGSRIVIAINRRFPGPPITAYENQKIFVHMRNLMHTESTTIHFHGMHQKQTPWSDGVAFVTQCPILPGQTYTYVFYAKPFGTSFYHAHIGDQRSAGLYGPLIIIPLSSSNISTPQDNNNENVHTVTIQDWNHFDDPETLYQRSRFGIFDLQKNKAVNATSDISGAKYSGFHCHSGLINGKGRFYSSLNTHNQAPLTKFDVTPHSVYRFRVISAATLYPFRVYIQGHNVIRIVSSDGFEMKPLEVESLIIHPGERIDFLVTTDKVSKNYLLIAETLEKEPKFLNQYHAAEAIIHYTNGPINLNPPKASQNTCTVKNKCKIFNCPFLYYPKSDNRICLTWNDATSIDPNSNIDAVKGKAIERFYNFAFPGENGNFPGSVNGHQFLPPTVAAYAEWDKVEQNCGKCNDTTICECTYYDTIGRGNTNQVYQFVLTNIGVGAGWSHPIHLHGHSFYVMKMGFASYDSTTGQLNSNGGQDQQDIICRDGKNFCSNANWLNTSWANGNYPALNWNNPPQKDTIILPTGGYVIIRFRADNPGVWFFHCHIDIHNTGGMGMMINESPRYHQKVPDNFPRCKSYLVKDATVQRTIQQPSTQRPATQRPNTQSPNK
ncbi:Hypothetical predicted protein, partial [Mytilus galloprovincialis]